MEDRALLVTTVAVVVAVVLAIVSAVTGVPALDLEVGLVVGWFEGGAGVVAVLLGAFLLLTNRLTPHATLLWTGAGVLLLGAVTWGVAGSIAIATGGAPEPLAWLRPASRLTAIALVALGVVRAGERRRGRPTRVIFMAASSAGLATLLMQLAAPTSALLGNVTDTFTGHDVGSLTGTWVLASVWAVAATSCGRLVRRTAEPLIRWIAILAGGLAAVHVVHGLAAVAGRGWSPAGHLLQLAVVSSALGGVSAHLLRLFAQHRRALARSLLDAEDASARNRRIQAQHEERLHDARGAVAAVLAALEVLGRARPGTASDPHAELNAVAVAELRRVLHLLGPVDRPVEAAPYRVREALRPIVATARSRGVEVNLEVDESLTAYGSWAHTTQVFQNLVDNALLYAPGSPIDISGAEYADRVEVRVEDRGPGVPRAERERIMERAVRGSHSTAVPGSGLGLYLAGRLMEEAGGSLGVEDRPGGGASFVVTLPRLPAGDRSGSAGSDAVADEIEQSLESGDVDRPLPTGGDDGALTAARGGVGQQDHG